MTGSRRELAARMADAALALLATLDGERQAAAAWPFPSDDERTRWYYTPTDHGGVALADLAPAQQRLALQLVASGLSAAGYGTVATIMGLENILDLTEGWRATFPGRERGRDPGRYYLRVFGDPASGTWSWRLGGHHVSLHHTVIDGEAHACTPSFLGADPASSPLLGPHPLRPLAGAEDLGRELVRAARRGAARHRPDLARGADGRGRRQPAAAGRGRHAAPAERHLARPGRRLPGPAGRHAAPVRGSARPAGRGTSTRSGSRWRRRRGSRPAR